MVQKNFQPYPEQLSFEEINNPFSVITAFFDTFRLDSAKKHIQKWLTAVYCPESWKQEPAELLAFHDGLVKIIECAWLIERRDNSKRLAVLSNDLNNFMRVSNYCPAGDEKNTWAYFPRSLSRKDYINPYRVFSKFFGHKDLQTWKSELYSLLNTALSELDLNELGNAVDVFHIKLLLDKLTDASHVIDVRERKVITLSIAVGENDEVAENETYFSN